MIGKLDVSVQHSIRKNRLEEVTEIVPYLTHDLIAEELKSASVLYLPINNTPNAKAVQTGKIFEYIAAERPILGIGPEEGDAARILNDTNAGIMIDFNNRDKIRNALLDFRKKFKEGKERKIEGKERYSRKNLTRQIAEVLQEIS